MYTYIGFMGLCDFIYTTYACIMWILHVTHTYTYTCASLNRQRESSIRPAIPPLTKSLQKKHRLLC